MADTNLPPKTSKLTVETVQMFTNAFVMAGIVFAIVQFYHTKNSERVQSAISAINQTKSSDFLKAYARIKTAYSTKKAEDQASLIDDLNFVMNTYDNIALLYINDLADRCVIRRATYSSFREIPSISDALSYPKEYRTNIDKLLVLMDKEVCE